VEKDARSDTEDEVDAIESDSELSTANGFAVGDHATRHMAVNHSD